MVPSWLAVLPLLVTAVVGQARRPCIGVARDAAGEPLVGATVTAVYASPGDPRFANDRRSAVTDARGRFRMPLWCGATYTSWLIGAPDDDGVCTVSRLRQGATGGGYFVIEAEASSRARTLRLEGLEAWRAHGASRIRLHLSGSDAEGTVAPVDLDAATCELPPLPASPIPFAVLDDDDTPLVLGLVPPDVAASARLAPPVERTVTVGGPAALLANATVQVLLRVPEPWDNNELLVPAHRYLFREAVAIDADRQARIVVPGPTSDPGYYWFRSTIVAAGAPGVAPVSATTDTSQNEVIGDSSVDASGPPNEAEPLHLTLASGPTVRLQSGAAGQRVLVVPQADREGSYYRAAMPQVVTLDANAPGVPSSTDWLHVRVWQRGDASILRLLASQPLRAAEEAFVTAAAPVPFLVRVVDADKGPGREAWVAVLRQDAQYKADGLDLWRRADSGGQVTLELPPGHYGVHATDGVGLGKAELEVTAGGKEPITLDLALERLPRLRCVVHDQRGAPVAGARVHTMRHGDRPASATDGFGKQHFDVAQDLAYRLAVRDVTDAAGRIDLPLIPLVSHNAALMFRRPDGSMTKEVAMRPSDEPVVVR